MPININTDLLRSVGIIGPDNNREVYDKFLFDYIQANPDLSTDPEVENGITRELLITRFLIDEAKASADEFLKSHGLRPILNELGHPAYHIEWDPLFMALKIKLKIAGQPRANDNEHFLSYEGREIEIKISNSGSNNDFNSQDLLDQITAKVDTANSLTAGTLKKQIKFLEEMCVKTLLIKLISKTSKAGTHNTLKDIPKQLESAVKQLPKTEVLDTYKDVIKDFLINVATVIIKHRERNDSYQPTEDEILEQLEIIKNAEINHISTKPRSILIDFYPQKTETGDLQYMHTVNTPNSDISSESRTLEKRIAPNLFHVQMATLKLAFDAKIKKIVITKKVKHASLYRSTSLAQLDKQEDAEALEIESLQALLIQKAREQIITKINNNLRADKTLKPNADIVIATAYISLLSPFIEKGSLTKLIAQASSLLPQTATLGDTIHIKNENEQLKSLVNALESLDKVKLFFSPEDIEYILDHTQDSEFAKRSGRVELKNFLQKKGITHVNFALNFVSNLGTHLFDWSNNNYAYNLAGLVSVNKIFAEFLNNNKIYPPRELFDSSEKTNKDWELLRNKLIALKQIESNYKVKEAIGLYIEVRDFIQLHAQWFNDHKGPNANSLIVDSILTAQKTAELASLLDLEVHAFCKSGKDRTGLFVAGLEATYADSDKNFDSNLYNAIHLSSAVTGIPVANGGGRVLQISAALLEGLKNINGQILENVTKIRDLIASWKARTVGKIGRSYPKAEDVKLYLKEQLGAKNSTITSFIPIGKLATPSAPARAAPARTAPAGAAPARTAPVVATSARPKPQVTESNVQQLALPINWRSTLQPIKPIPTTKEEKSEPPSSSHHTDVQSLIKHWENKKPPHNPHHGKS